MEREPGDDYIRRFATFLRSQERQLAESGVGRPKRNQSSSGFPSMLGWIGLESSWPSSNSRTPPTILSMDLHHLFYLLMRLEYFGIDVGPLDVKLRSNSRPVSYVSLLEAAKDRSDALSIASIASSVSKLSIGSGWWGVGQPRKPDLDLKYIYRCFTILPALSLCQSNLNVITELAVDPPVDNAFPLDAFKFIQRLELLDIDPRSVLGWDRLAEGLRSLTIKKSGLEDISDILVDAVADDEARRQGRGGPTVGRARRFSHRHPSNRSNRMFPPTGIPTPISEDAAERDPTAMNDSPDGTRVEKLSKFKWRFLKHLCLSDNALTFLPTTPLPYLTSITHLDLSSNLLISVPPGLSALHNLMSLNLSDNMIDSVLGIYTQLGQVFALNISKNRLESLCGLERLLALERVDIRQNQLTDMDEVGRLAVLPNIAEVFVDGNPFVRLREDYRVRCFEYFTYEGKSILLDGTSPSFFESRNMNVSSRPEADALGASRSFRGPAAPSPVTPPVVAIGSSKSPTSSPPIQQNMDSSTFVPTNVSSRSPDLRPTSGSPRHIATASPVSDSASGRKVKAVKRKPKRIVDLDGNQLADGSGSDNTITSSLKPKYKAKIRHAKGASEGTSPDGVLHSIIPSHGQVVSESRPGVTLASDIRVSSSTTQPRLIAQSNTTEVSKSNSRRARHTRYSTEGNPASPSSQVSDHRPPVYGSPQAVVENDDGDGVEDEGDKYRARIEGLRSEVGDDWLKVLSGGFAAQMQNGKRKPTLMSSPPQVDLSEVR